MLQRVLVLTNGTADAEYRATGLLDALNLQLSVDFQAGKKRIRFPIVGFRS